jgi:hypothetical protein
VQGLTGLNSAELRQCAERLRRLALYSFSNFAFRGFTATKKQAATGIRIAVVFYARGSRENAVVPSAIGAAAVDSAEMRSRTPHE